MTTHIIIVKSIAHPLPSARVEEVSSYAMASGEDSLEKSDLQFCVSAYNHRKMDRVICIGNAVRAFSGFGHNHEDICWEIRGRVIREL